MPNYRFLSTPPLVPIVLAGTVLSLAAPASGVAKSYLRHSPDPIAHITTGSKDSRILSLRDHRPLGRTTRGIIQTDLRRPHRHKAAKHHPRRRHTRRRAPAVIVRAPTAPVTCDNADTPAATASPDTMRAAIICLTNQQRAARGLPTLRENPRLDLSAQGWTDTMVNTGQFWHGTDFPQRIRAVGYDYWYAGENIGTGYATPRSVLTAWMASPGHCRNILNPSYAEIGVGLNPRPAATNVSDAATWTQDFGLTMADSLPSTNSTPMNSCGPAE